MDSVKTKDVKKTLTKFLSTESGNILDILDVDDLGIDIRTSVIDGLETDIRSRQNWADLADQVIRLCDLRLLKKSKPWNGAANVRYPLALNAVIEWVSKTYPEVIKDSGAVFMEAKGKDPQGTKEAKADRVGSYINYHLLEKSEEWAISVDKLLHYTALVGTAWKKIYMDPVEGSIKSDFCDYHELIVNNNIDCLKNARRITHIYPVHKNFIEERMRMGVFSEIELTAAKTQNIQSSYFTLPPLMVNEYGDNYDLIIEQHCYLDLDDDGYEEPYIVFIYEPTRELLCITPRYTEHDVLFKGNAVVRIKAENYFQDFHLIPSADGGYHSMGLGSLLLSPNTMINLTMNQLLDAGTLANMQGGIISGKGYRRDKGNIEVSAGEWTVMNGIEEVKMQPFNYKEPSATSFNMMQFLVQVSKETASTPDIAQGNQLAQNAPATSVLALIEQSQIVPSAILKRIYRAFQGEFRRWFKLIGENLNLAEYKLFCDETDPQILMQLAGDFDGTSLDIFPVLDPKLSSSAQRLAQANALAQMTQILPLNGQAIALQILTGMGIDNPQSMVQPPADPTQDPKTQAASTQAQVQIQQLQLDAAKVQTANQKQQTHEMLAAAQAEELKTKASKNLADASAVMRNSSTQANKQVSDMYIASNNAGITPPTQTTGVVGTHSNEGSQEGT